MFSSSPVPPMLLSSIFCPMPWPGGAPFAWPLTISPILLDPPSPKLLNACGF